VWQESNAEKALEALKELQSEHAKVLRDGKLVRKKRKHHKLAHKYQAHAA
jgi:magnesium-transporting ATPase (P-type)